MAERKSVAKAPRKTLRMGIIGCGNMGEIHAKCYAGNRNFAVGGYYDADRERSAGLAARFGGEVYDSAKGMVADPRIDGVAVCSPQAYHHEHIVAAASAGKHIFCEKPVALTARELNNIEKVVKKSGVTFMAGHQLRFHPLIIAVKRSMRKLGKCYHLELEWCFRISGHTGRCWENYRLGGFFMELGCHATDLACYLFGCVVNVAGFAGRLNPKRITEDYTNAMLQFESGAVASVFVSANHRTKRQGLLIGRIIGEKGRIDFTLYPYGRSFNKATLTIDRGKSLFVPDTTTTPIPIERRPSPQKTYPGYFDVYEQEAVAFSKAVRTGMEPPCTFSDGRNAIELVLAAYHSQGLATRSRNFVNRPSKYFSDKTCHPLLQ